MPFINNEGTIKCYSPHLHNIVSDVANAAYHQERSIWLQQEISDTMGVISNRIFRNFMKVYDPKETKNVNMQCNVNTFDEIFR